VRVYVDFFVVDVSALSSALIQILMKVIPRFNSGGLCPQAMVRPQSRCSGNMIVWASILFVVSHELAVMKLERNQIR